MLWGSADRFLPSTYAEAWRKALPEATVEIIPGAGHAVGLEQPDAAGAAITAFLAR